MSATTRRKKITIERRTPITDPGWGPSGETWSTFCHLWARVDEKPATESNHDGIQKQLALEIEIAFRANFTTEDRINFRGRILDVVSIVDPDNRGARLLVNAIEQAAQSVV